MIPSRFPLHLSFALIVLFCFLVFTGTFYTQKLELEDSKDSTTTAAVVKFNIWDTAGQDRFRSIAPLYYRGASAAIVVYDVTSYLSFVSAKSWIEELVENQPEILIVVVGNKVDLEPSRNTVTYTEAESYSEENGFLHLGTSAKTPKNVQELFYEIARKLPKPDPLLLPPDEEPQDEDGATTSASPLIVHPPGNVSRITRAQRLLVSLAISCCLKRKKNQRG